MANRNSFNGILKTILTLYSFLIMGVFFACSSPANTKQETEQVKADSIRNLPADTASMSIENDATNCFAYTKNRDTVIMTLVLNDTDATGKLTYNLFEKDKNTGTFHGVLKGDTLLANYSYLSEGSRSLRQVIFLRKGNMFQEGVGSMKEQNGRLMFSNKKDIDFNSIILLEAVDCSTF